jgi:hypothetical protein
MKALELAQTSHPTSVATNDRTESGSQAGFPAPPDASGALHLAAFHAMMTQSRAVADGSRDIITKTQQEQDYGS